MRLLQRINWIWSDTKWDKRSSYSRRIWAYCTKKKDGMRTRRAATTSACMSAKHSCILEHVHSCATAGGGGVGVQPPTSPSFCADSSILTVANAAAACCRTTPVQTPPHLHFSTFYSLLRFLLCICFGWMSVYIYLSKFSISRQILFGTVFPDLLYNCVHQYQEPYLFSMSVVVVVAKTTISSN